MTPDVNLPKPVPPAPAKSPRPPMAAIPKPILPVVVPAPAKLTKGDATTCDSSPAPTKGDGKSCDSSKQGH